MIVIVDDRSAVADAYCASFGREGIAASGFSLAEFEGWVVSAPAEDVIAIDAVLVGECTQARKLAHTLKRRSSAAIIAMKDERSLAATLEAFALGFDDVVAKPCHVREILARIEAIFRRMRAQDETSRDAIRIFRDGRDPIVNGQPVRLPRRELRILEFLVSAQMRRVTKSQIFTAVYGLLEQDIDETVVESHMSKLRRRLRERLGYDPIESQRHLGYRLVCRVDDQAVWRPSGSRKAGAAHS